MIDAAWIVTVRPSADGWVVVSMGQRLAGRAIELCEGSGFDL